MIRLVLCASCLAAVSAITSTCYGQSDGPFEQRSALVPVADPAADAALLPARRYVSSTDPYLPPGCYSSSCAAETGRDGCYRNRLEQAWHTRIKPCLQESHWGYCNHFDERPLGESLKTTMRRQIHRGSVDSLMLYHYDFYPPESRRAAELTARGEVQLLKLVYRMQATPAPIVVQVVDEDPELDEQRRQQVIAALVALGIDAAEQFVMLGRQKYGTPAVEAAETANNLLNAVRARGRTLRSAESPSFGNTSSGGGLSGFGN